MKRLVAEFLRTFWLVLAACGVVAASAPQVGIAPLLVGLALTLLRLIGIPVTSLSVNPARSTATAIFVHGWAMQQLWLFWVAPLAGAVLARVVLPLIAGAPVFRRLPSSLRPKT